MRYDFINMMCRPILKTKFESLKVRIPAFFKLNGIAQRVVSNLYFSGLLNNVYLKVSNFLEHMTKFKSGLHDNTAAHRAKSCLEYLKITRLKLL